MEILIILILILLGIIIPIKIFKPTFILLAAIWSLPLFSTITLPFITQINGPNIIYETLDPLLQWALSLMLIATATILYLEQIDANKKENEE